MRVVGALDGAVQAVAVSADGRLLAAAGGSALSVFEWGTDVPVRTVRCSAPPQLAFAPTGELLAFCIGPRLYVWRTDAVAAPLRIGGDDRFGGGVAFTPDGLLLATRFVEPSRYTYSQRTTGYLERRSDGGRVRETGYALPSAYPQLAVSPNGDFLAGITPTEFELRYANSGGLNVRTKPTAPNPTHAFLSFAAGNELVACGWDADVRVLEATNGREVQRLRPPDRPYRAAAFSGSGRHLVTADANGVLQFWDVGMWAVAREYDWGAGPVTALAFTADGTAGVCGTAAGRLIAFDVDE